MSPTPEKCVSAPRFPNPFVFPRGVRSDCFDELVQACEANWDHSVALLVRGGLANFFASLGRADLAENARQAAGAPDPALGLDALLTQLPVTTRQPARLIVTDREINLGRLDRDRDQHLSINLSRQGLGLVAGSVRSLDDWLCVEEDDGTGKKFQFRQELRIPVRAIGRRLRASNEILEGQLEVRSNAGSAIVTVRAKVPVLPFPTGVLAGAISPRELAKKARSAPKKASSLFENGAVAAWYASNGWTYPVAGSPATGVAAVQQFFEVLGLVRPPRVKLLTESVEMRGRAETSLRDEILVRACTPQPVVASGVSSAAWLEVGKPTVVGRTACLPLSVPQVPALAGESLEATVEVVASGGQRFTVPVRLQILPAASSGGEQPIAVNVPKDRREATNACMRTPACVEVLPADGNKNRPRGWGRRAVLLGVVPALTLLLCFLGMQGGSRNAPPARKVVGGKPPDIRAIPATGGVADAAEKEEGLDPRPRLELNFSRGGFWTDSSMSFGLTALVSEAGERRKLLTFCKTGSTNNTVVRLDGRESCFGRDSLGRWKQQESGLPITPYSVQGRESTWAYDREQVEILQRVEVVRGTQSRLLDTCLIRYRMTNNDRVSHMVGLRLMLDTYIGANDGVPFLIPGSTNLCDTSRDFRGTGEVPAFLQACENNDLARPGTVAHVGLKVSGLEPPSRVSLTAWPGYHAPWEVPVRHIRSDSCVVLYWAEQGLEPGQSREVGFCYGLGQVSSAEGTGKLAVTAGGSFEPGGEFLVTAYVSNPLPTQTVTLQLPEGFALTDGQARRSVQGLPPNASTPNSPVTWKVRGPQAEGTYVLRVLSNTGIAQTQSVNIRPLRLFRVRE